MNINDYCCTENSDEYLQIKSYIAQNGAEFETTDTTQALEYFKSLRPEFGPLYIINENGLYQFIMTTS
jgi:hypothetical protein